MDAHNYFITGFIGGILAAFTLFLIFIASGILRIDTDE